MKALVLVIVLTLAASGCATHPEQPAPKPAAPTPAPPTPPKPPPPAPPPPAPPREPTDEEKRSAQDEALQGVELLQDGKVPEARIRLAKALKLDPHNVLATTLWKQLDGDPVVILGKEYFIYKVQPGDTLSRIAERFFGDKYMFHILARYNNITTPRQLQAGQMIKIPGKPPKTPPAPPPTPPDNVKPPAGTRPPGSSSRDGEANALRAYDNAIEKFKLAQQYRQSGKSDKMLEYLDQSHEYYREASRYSPQTPELIAKRDQIKRPLADAYYREAMRPYYNQQLDLAISLFERCLEVDPEHPSAADYLRKAKDLRNRANRFPSPSQ